MSRIFTISATLPEDDTVEREFRCESKDEALRLMKSKFSEAISIHFVSEREITVDDLVDQESTRVECRLRELDELQAKHRQQKNRGKLVAAVGVVATIALYFYGWIAWFTLLPIGIGIYEFSNGSWGEKRVKQMKSWEMEKLES